MVILILTNPARPEVSLCRSNDRPRTAQQLFAQAVQIIHPSLRRLQLFLKILLLREKFLEPERGCGPGFLGPGFGETPQMRLTLFSSLEDSRGRFTELIPSVDGSRQGLVASVQTAPRFLRVARHRRAGGGGLGKRGVGAGFEVNAVANPTPQTAKQ